MTKLIQITVDIQLSDKHRADLDMLGIDLLLSCAEAGRAGFFLDRGLAERLATALGVSAETLLRLDAAWQERHPVTPNTEQNNG